MWKVSSSCSQPSPQNRLIFHHLFLNMMPGKMDHTIPIPPLQISDPTQCHYFWLPLWLAACQYIICWAGLVYVQRSEQGFSSLPLVFFYIEIFASTHAIRNYIAMNSVVQICLISGEVDFGHGVELIYLIFFLQYIFPPKYSFLFRDPWTCFYLILWVFQLFFQYPDLDQFGRIYSARLSLFYGHCASCALLVLIFLQMTWYLYLQLKPQLQADTAAIPKAATMISDKNELEIR